MKYLVSLLCLMISFAVAAQPTGDEDRYYFHVTINNPMSLLATTNPDGTYKVVSSSSQDESKILSSYTIFEFAPTFTGTNLSDLKNVYTICTDRVELLGALMYNFPEKYTKIDQFYPNEAPFYPNDYGSTSPKENKGTHYPLYDLDLVNAPKAWGITQGSKKVVIGISDGKIDSTNLDMKGRVSNYLYYSNADKGLVCSHGTSVAGIAIAHSNNAFGRPGICSGCDVIANTYGDFKYVEELVAAGARVINTSWARCNMGPYHKEIEARINELYEDGILIVAGAGNAKNCNRDDDYAPDDYAYPASYERVISVTGVYTKFDKAEDSTYIGKEGRPTAGFLKDRHSSEYGIRKNGELFPKYNKWDMQANDAIDICAPSQSYLLGNADCGDPSRYGGATSSTAPYITGVIGLMWSVNYCLDAYETESVLKLTAAAIEQLPGNEMYAGKLGAGRVDAYKALKMARDMKELMGKVEINGRDFHRFDFRLRNAPYDISIRNATFRDSSTVDFKARNSIVLQPGTRLAPDTLGSIKLTIDPDLPTAECFPKEPKKYESVFAKSSAAGESPGKIVKTFTVDSDSTYGTVSVIPEDELDDSLNGRTYEVMVLSPTKQVLVRKSFRYPNAGTVDVVFGAYSFLIVDINFNGKKEQYRVKK